MPENTRSPWTERERDALSSVLHDHDERLRDVEVQLAVIKTKLAAFGAMFGVIGAAVAEGVKYLMGHH